MAAISQTEYARRVNLSQPRISQLIASGKIPPSALVRGNGGRVLIDPDLADAALLGSLDPAQRVNAKVSPGGAGGPATKPPAPQQAAALPVTFEQARTRREIVRGEVERLKLEELRGKLASRADVETAAFERARAVRDAMLAIPDRISPLLAAESDEHSVNELLRAEIEAALSALSR